MKTTNLLLTIAASGGLFLASCGGNHAHEGEATTEETIAAEAVTKTVNPAASTVNWVGKMIGIKAHSGTVALKEGTVTLQDHQVLVPEEVEAVYDDEGNEISAAQDSVYKTIVRVVGGSFTVDMTTIVPLDENYAPDGSAQGTRAMLLGHLGSGDFFAIEENPTATFEVTGTNKDGSVNGNLTVRGKTNAEKVTDVVVADGTVTGTLVFDRKKYDVAWDSPMKDAVLSNDIELNIELKVAG